MRGTLGSTPHTTKQNEGKRFIERLFDPLPLLAALDTASSALASQVHGTASVGTASIHPELLMSQTQ